MAGATAMCVVLCLLTGVVEVYSETFPYIRFMGTNLSNHSYVNLTLVGNGSDSVQCHTDLDTCCRSHQGAHRGDWFFPNGSRLGFSISSTAAIVQRREAQRVDVLRKGNGVESGIYRCDIETNAVNNGDNNNDDDNDGNEIVYVGLYSDGG